MTPQGPLARRIAERKPQPEKPARKPQWQPAWRRWTQEHGAAKDMTGKLS